MSAVATRSAAADEDWLTTSLGCLAFFVGGSSHVGWSLVSDGKQSAVSIVWCLSTFTFSASAGGVVLAIGLILPTAAGEAWVTIVQAVRDGWWLQAVQIVF